MAMTAGSVTVNDDESHAGTGLALEIYLADKATLTLPAVPTVGLIVSPYSTDRPSNSTDVDLVKAQRVAALREAARRATAYAVTVTYIQNNGVARVTSESLGRTPDPNSANTPIQAPSSPVNIPIF